MPAQFGVEGWLAGLLASMLTGQTAALMMRPAITYRALELGAGAWQVGLLLAAYAIVPAVVALPMGRVCDRGRPLSVLVAGAVVMAAGGVVTATAASVIALAVGSCLQGLAALAAMVGGQSVVARLAGPGRLDTSFGYFSAAISLGQMVGPLAGGVLLGSSTSGAPSVAPVCLVGSAVALASLPLVLWIDDRRPPGAVPAAAGRESAGDILRRPGVVGGMLSSVAILTTIDILVAFLPLLGQQRHIGPVLVGALLSLRAGASVASRLSMTSMLRRWRRTTLLGASTAGSGIFVIAIPLVPNVALIALVMVCAGFFLGLGQPLSMSHVAQAVPFDARGTALSLRLTGNKIGQSVVPIAVSAVAGSSGTASAFWVSGASLGIATWVGSHHHPSQGVE